MGWQLPIGAQIEDGGVRFRVWAPAAQKVEVVLFDGENEISSHAMRRDDEGYWVGLIEGISAGARYMYRLDGDKLRPDPASRYQPQGVHKVSEVLSSNDFAWTDEQWQGIAPEDVIIYEAHVGTATAKGTFTALADKLQYFRDLGVTAIEIMPLADFPGQRNWGYDGVCLFAPANAYGHPADFKRVVNDAHALGLAVILDVVYNHLGPDGNYLRDFSPDYFTEAHHTPWGAGLNYGCMAVREFFINNALYWAHEFHVDGLRLDATHAIQDDSPTHILAEINQRVHASLPEGRHFVIYAEDERNDTRLITPVSEGGYGLDGVWADDFHHEARVAVTGENEGYYQDYTGSPQDLATTIMEGWFYHGQVSPHSQKPRGTPAGRLPAMRYVHCIQNHDQIGNRPFGDRLNQEVSLAAYRALSALLLCSPYTPLLFMGQEWAASTPWQFFTDHNPDLGKLVTEGRRKEFSGFSAFKGEEIPDPQAAATFENSKLKWDEAQQLPHSQILALYKDLLELRRTAPALIQRERDSYIAAALGDKAVALQQYVKGDHDALLLVVNLGDKLEVNLLQRHETTPRAGYWDKSLFTEDERYGGRGKSVYHYDSESGALSLEGACAVLLRSV